MSNVNQLIQNIVALREINVREQAQKLADQMAPYSQAATQAGTLATLQGVGQNLSNPAQLAPFAGQLGPAGLDPGVLQTIFQGSPPTAATTVATAANQGRTNPNATQLDKNAAEQLLTGEHTTPESQLRDQLFNQAHGILDQLPPEQQHSMVLGFLTKQSTGQSLTGQLLDEAGAFLSPEDRKLAVKFKLGLALTPAETEQLALGYTNARIQDRQVTAAAAADGLRAQAALAEVQARYGAQKSTEVNQLLIKRDELMQKLLGTSATLTSEGKLTTSEQVNAYNEQLRQAAPEVYGPKGRVPLTDLPTGGTIGTTGFSQYLQQSMRGK